MQKGHTFDHTNNPLGRTIYTDIKEGATLITQHDYHYSFEPDVTQIYSWNYKELMMGGFNITAIWRIKYKVN